MILRFSSIKYSLIKYVNLKKIKFLKDCISHNYNFFLTLHFEILAPSQSTLPCVFWIVIFLTTDYNINVILQFSVINALYEDCNCPVKANCDRAVTTLSHDYNKCGKAFPQKSLSCPQNLILASLNNVGF